MYDKISLTSILFLDIECVCGEPSFEEVAPALQALWAAKAPRIMRVDELSEEEIAQSYVDKAAIYAEFGKIVCISVGILAGAEGEETIRVKSFADPDERVLLEDFSQLLKDSGRKLNHFCGHNIKEFDMPYIGRRMLINGMRLHPLLDLRGKKPWETKHLVDTMDMWSFGDRKNYTSLKLLAALFGVPSPKDDIDGSQVGRVFWEENDLERIAIYCEKDVVATTNVFMAMTNRKQISDDRVLLVSRPKEDAAEADNESDAEAGAEA
ncbi:MAG: ribonuclease H-like domain-containing protein [Saprospiraceae bacterium]